MGNAEGKVPKSHHFQQDSNKTRNHIPFIKILFIDMKIYPLTKKTAKNQCPIPIVVFLTSPEVTVGPTVVVPAVATTANPSEIDSLTTKRWVTGGIIPGRSICANGAEYASILGLPVSTNFESSLCFNFWFVLDWVCPVELFLPDFDCFSSDEDMEEE